MRMDKQMDGHGEAKSRFRYFVNAPKNRSVIEDVARFLCTLKFLVH